MNFISSNQNQKCKETGGFPGTKKNQSWEEIIESKEKMKVTVCFGEHIWP